MRAKHLSDRLLDAESKLPSLRAVTGFDGFVDEMITVVNERQALDQYSRVDTISNFGQLVSKSAGRSSLREIVITETSPGGCAINLGDGLASLGVKVDTFATVGTPIHDAFRTYGNRARLHSWGREPGHTYAYEFADGKLMFSSVSHLAEFTSKHVAEKLSDGSFLEACQSASLIALTDWTLYPHMTGCWDLLNRDVFGKLSHRPNLIIDLVDPSTRSEEDIRIVLGVLSEFEMHCQTSLSLNKNEANILSNILYNDHVYQETLQGSMAQAEGLRDYLDISEIVIHTHHYAVSTSAAGTFYDCGPYCEKPVKSTGAGDRFNAGYSLGLILGFEPKACLRTANATAGCYIRKGVSPTLHEIRNFINKQMNNRL